MSEMKPTPGPWSVDDAQPGDAFRYVIHGDGDSFGGICRISTNGNANADADARLIAEAGTVHHETGLTPRQLVERVKELEGALIRAQEAINSMKVEAETAAQGDEQMMLEACETISNEGLDADMEIRDPLSNALPQRGSEGGGQVNRLKEFAALYRIYRQCHKPIAAARYAWVVSGG